jgi:hypothetical protein
VGVKIAGELKMSEIFSVAAFPGFMTMDRPAHLTLSGFQLFSLLTLFLKWTMMMASAQLNLENQIH